MPHNHAVGDEKQSLRRFHTPQDGFWMQAQRPLHFLFRCQSLPGVDPCIRSAVAGVQDNRGWFVQVNASDGRRGGPQRQARMDCWKNRLWSGSVPHHPAEASRGVVRGLLTTGKATDTVEDRGYQDRATGEAALKARHSILVLPAICALVAFPRCGEAPAFQDPSVAMLAGHGPCPAAGLALPVRGVSLDDAATHDDALGWRPGGQAVLDAGDFVAAAIRADHERCSEVNHAPWRPERIVHSSSRVVQGLGQIPPWRVEACPACVR